jgi:hypothetical protein
LFVDMSSGMFMIISRGFHLVCMRAFSWFPHFVLVSWSRASISSLLFVSIIIPPLHDLKVLTPL